MWHSGIPEWSRQQIERVKKEKQQRVLEYEKNPIKCKRCNLPLPYEKRHCKFCNNSCAASLNNLGVRKHGKDPGSCIICGKKLSSNLHRHCSTKCSKITISKQNREKHEQYIQSWLSGKEKGYVGEQVTIYIKRYLLEKYDSKCQECGWNKMNQTTGKIPLAVHHDNGDWKDNRLSNLKLLCPNCHSLTPTYGSGNRGKGRAARRSKRQLTVSSNQIEQV